MKSVVLSTFLLASLHSSIGGTLEAGKSVKIKVSDEDLSYIDRHFTKAYREKGFTDEEAEIISSYLKDAHVEKGAGGLIEIEKAVLSASKRLGLSSYQVDKINEVNLDEMLKVLSFVSLKEVKSCIQKRSSESSECTKAYVEGFLKQVSKYAVDGYLEVTKLEVKKLRDDSLQKISDECSEDSSSLGLLLKLNLRSCDPL